MNPEVSIIIPTYNSEAYIGQALESVFNQTYNNFEVILVDDASTDSTVEIARNFHDRRLKIMLNQQNRGVSYSRNCGIKAAQGAWIALLDSDDWYAPERLEKLLLVGQQEDADLVADDLNLVRDRESQPWSTLLQENEAKVLDVKIIDACEFVISDRPNPLNAKRNWSFGYTKPLMRRDFLLQHKIEYDPNIHVGEDYVLYLECLRQQARFAFVPQAYYYYRTRDNSLSSRKPTDYLADSCHITNIFIDREIKSHKNSFLLPVLLKNLVIYQKRLAYYRLLAAMKQKNLLKAIALIVDHPHTLGYLFSKSINVLYKKSQFIFYSDNSPKMSFNPVSIDE